MAELYRRGLTLAEISHRYGMTRQGVRYRFVASGISRRPHSKYCLIDKRKLEKLYLEDRLPLKEIAIRCAVSRNVIRQALKFHGIGGRASLKVGGSHVDRLRGLAVGEMTVIKWNQAGLSEFSHLGNPDRHQDPDPVMRDGAV